MSLSPARVLLDLYDETTGFVLAVCEETPTEALHWRTDAGGNTIAQTIWHIGRLLDYYLHQCILGLGAEDEIWQREGWAERSGYDPRGIGAKGAGILTGYTADEVARVPALDGADLAGYYGAVLAAVRGHIESLGDEGLQAPAAGEGAVEWSVYDWLRWPLMDNARHLGEIWAIRAIWERTVAVETEAETAARP